MSKITEHHIGEAVLEILANSPGGTATIRELKRDIPKYVNLCDEDRKQSPTRQNEEVWEQQVRNLVSHRNTEGNIICEGLAGYQPDQLTITDAGRLHVKHKKG